MFKLNIFTGNFDEVGASSASPFFGPPVNTETDLPVPGVDGELRVVKLSRDVYQFNIAANNWKNVTQDYIDAVGSTPNANGLSQSTSVNINGVVEKHLQLQPANGLNPGLLTAASQSIGGIKTFDATVKLANGIDSSTVGGTIGIGFTDAATINIGNAGATVNIQGATNIIDVTNLEVTDKNITVNKNGPTASASGAGLEVEENAIITGYAVVSPARTAWNLKAPATAGIVSVVPGASGFTLDQGSHNPVSFSTPGLGITFNSGTQALSAQLASTIQPGLLSSTDFTTFNNKADSNLGNLTSPTAINQTLLPDTDSSRNIGNFSLKFNAIFTNGIYNGSALAYNVSINTLVDASGVSSIRANSRELIDASNFAAINYNNRTLNDTAGNAALSYAGPNIDVLTRKIINVVDPTGTQDAATKNYVDTGISTLSGLTIKKDGSVAFTGNQSMGSNLLTNLLNPASNQDAATKIYVDTSIAQAFVAGDIAPSSFNAANNQAAPANVTGLVFAAATTRSFDALVSVALDATAPAYEAFKIIGINIGGVFSIQTSSVGDVSGVSFNITAGGQIQYTSSNAAGFVSLKIGYRAITTQV